MFTPVEIEEAFRRLFGLYNQEKVSLLKSAFKEEIKHISPEILAWKYSKCAFRPLGYCEMKQVNEPAQWDGFPLLDQRAAFVAEEMDTYHESENFKAFQSIELWLVEDMTFASVLCTKILSFEEDKVIKGIECRTFLKFVEEGNDIPVCVETLMYTLEDTCMFAQVEENSL